MIVERVETLYSPGKPLLYEDGFFYSPHSPFYGVFDGTSGIEDLWRVYVEGMPLKGKSGGFKVVRNIIDSLEATDPSKNLKEAVLKANKDVRKNKRKITPIGRSDLLPAAAFAVAKIGRETVEIIQGADCFAFALTNQGVITTPNQHFPLEVRQRGEMAKLINQYERTPKMWSEFIPRLADFRLESYNKPDLTLSCVINGQSEIELFWQHLSIPLEGVKVLILCTDGFVPFKETSPENIRLLAEKMFRLYKEGGLSAILRKTEEEKRRELHEDDPEATAMAIKFKAT